VTKEKYKSHSSILPFNVVWEEGKEGKIKGDVGVPEKRGRGKREMSPTFTSVYVSDCAREEKKKKRGGKWEFSEIEKQGR